MALVCFLYIKYVGFRIDNHSHYGSPACAWKYVNCRNHRFLKISVGLALVGIQIVVCIKVHVSLIKLTSFCSAYRWLCYPLVILKLLEENEFVSIG